jgi:cytochrome c553
MNMQISKTDRQATLRGSCAACHAQPAVGREGRELYLTACAICHNAEHRASAVPDLQVMGSAKDAAYWRQFVSEGKPSSMMPAFAREQGGFLTEQQIASLVAYLVGDFRKEGRIVYRDSSLPASSAMKPAPPLTPAVMTPIPGAFGTNGRGSGGAP